MLKVRVNLLNTPKHVIGEVVILRQIIPFAHKLSASFMPNSIYVNELHSMCDINIAIGIHNFLWVIIKFVPNFLHTSFTVDFRGGGGGNELPLPPGISGLLGAKGEWDTKGVRDVWQPHASRLHIPIW